MSDQTKLVSPNLKHAPGPWINKGRLHGYWRIDSASDEAVSVVALVSDKENVPLVTAAPVLLDAIERAMAVLHPNAWSPESSNVARGEAFGILRAALEDLTA